jgi:hypothetical protein
VRKKVTPEVYWIRDIEPLRLALMPRPRGGEWLEDEVAGWKGMGVDVVVSLLHPYEAHELEILEEESLCSAHGIKYRSFPIQDRGVPESARLFSAFSDELAVLVKEGSAVAIHCRAGIGRSALAAGSVLLKVGIPAAEVFPILSRSRGLAVPDTSSQEEWFNSVCAREIAL